MTTRQVAERLGWSASTISRIETGIRSVSSEDVSALLALYQVTGSERDRLLELARESSNPGWWETSSSALPPQLGALINFESQAIRITDVETLLVPGLLQTAEYARAVMAATEVPTAETEPMVATRMGRQAVLTRPNPPELLAIVDEAALRRPLGGRDVMAQQIRHIVKMSERPNITVQVIPYGSHGHVALDGSYVVLEFASARTVVHLEHKRSGLFLDDPSDVEPFIQATDILKKTALEPAASEKFLLKVADEYER